MVVCRPKSRLPPSKSSSSSAHAYHALAELLGKPDNDALGAADVAEPIRVLVLHHFADQFGAVGAQARDDDVDVIDGQRDAADPECVHRNVLGPSSDRFRRVELVQLDPSVAVRSAHQREGSTDVLKADETIYRGAFDGRFALQLHTKLDKERLRSLKVVNHDENVVHPPNRHGSSPSSSRGPSWPLLYLGRS